jgi:hypothetical protein
VKGEELSFLIEGIETPSHLLLNYYFWLDKNVRAAF